MAPLQYVEIPGGKPQNWFEKPLCNGRQSSSQGLCLQIFEGWLQSLDFIVIVK